MGLYVSGEVFCRGRTAFLEGPRQRDGLHLHADRNDKYIFLFPLVTLLCFLHQFLSLLELRIHQLLLQLSVLKYFVQMLREEDAEKPGLGSVLRNAKMENDSHEYRFPGFHHSKE